MKSKDTLAGLIIGAATGVAFGLLFAPRKGKDTRKALVENGGDYLERFSDDIKLSIEDKLDNFLTKNSTKAEERAKKQIEEVKKEIASIKAK